MHQRNEHLLSPLTPAMADYEELVQPKSFLQSRRVRTKSVFHFSWIDPLFASHEHAHPVLTDKLNDHQLQLRDRTPTIGFPGRWGMLFLNWMTRVAAANG